MPIKHRKLKLTGQRTKWVQGREVSLRGTPTRMNPQTMNSIADEVIVMFDKMQADVYSQLTRLFKTPTAKNSIVETERVDSLDNAGMVTTAMDASISSQAIELTNKLVTKWTDRFNSFGNGWANRMTSKIDKQSSKDLNKSMEKISGGLNIDTGQLSEKTRDTILSSTDQASSLIKSIGPNYTTQIKEAVNRSIVDSSSSLESLQNSIQSALTDKYKNHKNKAFNVAKDQIKKSYAGITASRMQNVGVSEYIWRHAGGSVKPRCFHRDVLNGQIFSLDNPPIIEEKTGIRGKPGDLPFCNCYMEPVISFDNKK